MRQSKINFDVVFAQISVVRKKFPKLVFHEVMIKYCYTLSETPKCVCFETRISGDKVLKVKSIT